MSMNLRFWGTCRILAVRPKPANTPFCQIASTTPRRRPYSDTTNSDTTPSHNAKSNDATEPVVKSPQGKPDVAPLDQTVSQDETAAQLEANNIPHDALGDQALEQMLYGGRSVAIETQDGLTPAQEEVLYRDGMIPPAAAAEMVLVSQPQTRQVSTKDSSEIESVGHKWDLPQRPFPDDYHHRQRYHPVLHQISRLLMRDGKLSAAQKNLAMVMNHLRTTPAPIYSPKFPLLPGTPPASHLPLNPVLYLTIAIDSVAPIIRINRIAGGAGGGRALDMPTPIAVRARRRQAFQWIMDSVNNKPSRGSGSRQLPVRIAEEIIAVIEGRSGVWDKRKLVHKVGTAARGNIGKAVRVKKKA